MNYIIYCRNESFNICNKISFIELYIKYLDNFVKQILYKIYLNMVFDIFYVEN